MTEGVNATQPQLRTVAAVAVQTGGMGLPSSDGGWSTQRYLRFDGASEGCATVLGEARLVEDFGVMLPQGGSTFQSVGIAPDIGRGGTSTPLIGQTVRLLKQDGGPVLIDGKNYTPFWWGRIIASEHRPDNNATRDAGGRMTWSAVGIASVFDQLPLTRGLVVSTTPPLCGLGYLPPFNQQAGGDRSTSTFTVNGSTVYVHDLANGASGNQWTARQALEHVLALGTLPALGDQGYFDTSSVATRAGVRVVLDPSVGTLLDFILPPTDVSGLTLFQAINALVSVKRALVWKLSLSGSTISVKVYSASGTAVAVGSFTMPASGYTASLVAAGSLWLSDVKIVQDNASLYDVIEVQGAHPWIALSLAYIAGGGGQLVGANYGWSSAAETVWQTNPTTSLVEHVWRLFYVDPVWNGIAYAASGGGAGQMTTAAYGNGTRDYTGPMPPSRVIPGERMLPCSPGFSTLKIGPRQAPLVCVNPTSASNSWIDKSKEYRVEVLSDPLAVHVDDGQFGIFLKNWTAAGGAFVVTVGMREFLPLRVSYNAALSRGGATVTPRVKVIHLPNCELWRVPAGTVTGVDPNTGALTTLPADVTVRDDTPTLSQALTLAAAWYGQPAYRVSWRDRGNHDIGDAYAPARLLTSVQLGDSSYGMYALITRRSWVVVDRDGLRTIDTIYETERVLPDLEAVL